MDDINTAADVAGFAVFLLRSWLIWNGDEMEAEGDSLCELPQQHGTPELNPRYPGPPLIA
jgi:hypothetical protein